MTERQIEIVQKSFQEIEPVSDEFASKFYDNLFMINPELKKLFRTDMEKQRQMLVSALSLAVKGLNNPESLGQPLRELGQRHKEYGVKERDYETVGRALINTISEQSNVNFNKEVKQSWLSAYVTIADFMLRK